MKKKLVDTGNGNGWDYEPLDVLECEFVPFYTYEVKYGDNTIEFNNAKEAYKFYKTIKEPKVLWGIMQSGFSELLVNHEYE